MDRTVGTLNADDVRRLLVQAGLGADYELTPLPGGGNNRVFRVEAGSREALLKAYFRHPGDPRDRLGAEHAFTGFAWARGLRCIPEPLGSLTDLGLGLYEFVAGQPFAAGNVSATEVSAALAFYHELNAHRAHPDAARLPVASEACFSLAEHLHTVERRLERLSGWQPQTRLDREAAEFIAGTLQPRWDQVRRDVETAVGVSGLAELLTPDRRRLSPSDFGYHNALREPSGAIRFLDFEYAGWDDPAKLVCDFFCQAAIPVPMEHLPAFVESVTGDLPDAAAQRRRVELLLPVYRVKWVCIMLNDFLVTGDERRRFARPGEDPEQRRAMQLDKARRALQKA